MMGLMHMRGIPMYVSRYVWMVCIMHEWIDRDNWEGGQCITMCA